MKIGLSFRNVINLLKATLCKHIEMLLKYDKIIDSLITKGKM